MLSYAEIVGIISKFKSAKKRGFPAKKILFLVHLSLGCPIFVLWPISVLFLFSFMLTPIKEIESAGKERKQFFPPFAVLFPMKLKLFHLLILFTLCSRKCKANRNWYLYNIREFCSKLLIR